MAGTGDGGGAGGQVLDIAFLAGAGPSNATALLEALREQSLTPGDVTVVEPADRARDLAAALGARTDRPIAVLDADLVVSSVPLGAVLDDPRLRTAALAEPASHGDDRDVPTSEVELLGVLRVAAADRASAGGLAAGLTGLSGAGGPDAAGGPADEPLLALTRALQAAGTDVRPVQLTGYVWARPGDETEATSARAGVAALPERRVRLREAARGGDGFYSTFVLRKLSWRFTDVALRLGLTPNQVTVISLVLGLAAAVCLGTAQRPWMVLGAVLLQVCLIVDCVDGELARFRRRFSRFGAWLDATTDRVKEFAAIGGLAVAADRAAGDQTPVWWLAALAIGVQTFRHVFELGWSLQREYATGGVTPAPPRWRASQVRLRFKQIAKPEQNFDWLRRLGHFPIGERFLVMSLGAALWNARGTLYLLTIGGVLAGLYMLAAFVVRARSARAPAPRLRAMLDVGPLLRLVPLPPAAARRGEALLPALVAAAELVLLWLLPVRVGGASEPAALALVGAAAIAHYQHVYGVRESAGAGRRRPRPTLGTDGRLLVAIVLTVAAVALDSSDIATAGAWALAVVVLIDTVLGSLSDWVGGGSAQPADQKLVAQPAPQHVPDMQEAPGDRPVIST